MSILVPIILVLAVAYFIEFVRKHRSPGVQLSAAQRVILSKYAIHYQRLPAAEQRRVEAVVSAFLHRKEWMGAGMPVAEEMKVMIAACAAQLLFPFPDLELVHFQRIIVYPDTYRSPRSGRMHQGEVRPQAGVIVISWDDFVHGYAHSRDAHNVGLHEMAHALWFENLIRNDEHEFLEPRLLAQWKALATREVAKIKAREPHYFRDYAGTNQAEFFAVAVEYFFEQPRVFREALPEVYHALVGLLRQDPAEVA
ncbi:MAG: zinc-dependent peptidase [Flavobacteriales bacterium]|nr:zinc-dependent peptidase [Flavobacteriales bacterium]